MWEYHEHREGWQLPSALVADALQAFHKAFRPFDGHLVPFTDHVDHAGKVLGNSSLTPKLAVGDRTFLRRRYETLNEAVASLTFEAQPLHGEPHLDGNVLRTDADPLLIDFEAACLGPTEWDLTALPHVVAASYRYVDWPLLDLLSDLRSLTVATWCWMQPERAPEVEEAAHHHLQRLRARPSS
ncbi:MAG: phosphotransferase [Actinobacteria bacterium]|nr:phosphotransferase [Actinomycetota bacterium]